jgi:hypothetical protein
MRDRLPLILSSTALLVAVLGSTPLGQAALDAVVPKNSVGTPQLKRNAVKAAKLAPSTVRTGHVLNGSLLVEDFKAGQIPQGPKGDKGDKGDAGAQGPPGLAGLEIVTASSVNNNAGGLKEATATCPAGKKVTGGGTQTISSPAIPSYGYPVGDNAWKGVLYSSAGPFVSVRVFAACATVQ